MTDSIDQLLTIAEIGAALAGFTAIVAAFSSDIRNTPRFRISFWIMIEFSFALIMFSLIPVAIFNFHITGTVVWTISSATMAAFIPAHIFLVGRRFVMPAVESGDFQVTAPIVVVPLFLVVFSIQVLNAFGVLLSTSFAAYFLGLAFFILLVFANFANLLMQFWGTSEEDV